jgi:hypothetical protein
MALAATSMLLPLLLLALLLPCALPAGSSDVGDVGDDGCAGGELDAHGKCLSSERPGVDAAAVEAAGGDPRPPPPPPPLEPGELGAAADLVIPNITKGEFVVDHAQLFTPEERAELGALLRGAKQNSTVLPLVVTVAYIPQPVGGQTLHRAQLVRQFGTAVSRHFFQGSTAWQLKTLIFIVQKRMAAPPGTEPADAPPELAPRIDVFTGKKAKQKLKDGRIRQILRHPNVTRALGHTEPAEPDADAGAAARVEPASEGEGEGEGEARRLAPRYFEATRLVVDRATTAARQSGGLFGGSGGGMTGLLPIMVGGCFFLYFNKTKFGNKRSSQMDSMQMDREFQQMMASDPKLAAMMGEMGGGGMGGGGMGGMGGRMGSRMGGGMTGRGGGMSGLGGGLGGMGGMGGGMGGGFGKGKGRTGRGYGGGGGMGGGGGGMGGMGGMDMRYAPRRDGSGFDRSMRGRDGLDDYAGGDDY